MRTALVTGASRGIGAAIARGLAADGYRIAVNYHSREADAKALCRELQQIAGLPHILVRADVSDRSQVESMFHTIGEVDVLVNNAGIAQQKLFTDLTEADWDRMFDVDVKGVFHCCQLALPHMIHQKSGAIVNISSMWGQVGASCEVCYSATKAAVIGMTKALAKEVGLSGIQVNCVAPGVIATEMNAHLSGADMQALAEDTPLGRLGAPEDISRVLLFLASEDADFITGQVLGVNGGFVI